MGSLRALVSSLAFVVYTFIGSVLALLSLLVDRRGDSVLKLGRLWARAILATAGVKLDVRSRAHLDPKRPYVFMANHLSTVDIWAVLVAVPVPFSFIAKSQLGRIPLFGWAMRAGRFIFIDRKNPSLARKSIDEAARRIRGGQSVLIYPEGTRSRDGHLAPFKQGGFHLAIDSGADVVPVAIRGSREVMPRGTPLIRAGDVSIEIAEPISTAGLGSADREQLVERVRGRIVDMLGEAA
jgi:1-acyl-sn-glycerol-3-phosphate acyltransferase